MSRARPMYTNRSEPDLVDAARDGDQDAFEELFHRNQRRVYSVALNFFGGNTQAAEDVTQQVFFRFFRGLERFRGESQVSTWLYRVTVNQCIDEQKRRRRFWLFGDLFTREEEDHIAIEEDTGQLLELSEEVRKAVGGLKPIFRLPVILKHVAGMSYAEMAEVLNVSEGTVASRLSRGHKMLAEKLSHLKTGS